MDSKKKKLCKKIKIYCIQQSFDALNEVGRYRLTQKGVEFKILFQKNILPAIL